MTNFNSFSKNKFNAFTLIELVVVMLLSSIIVLIAFQAIQNTQSGYLLFEKNTHHILEVSDFNTILQQDFQESDLVKKENNQLFLTHSKGEIIYTLNDQNIIRLSQLHSGESVVTSYQITLLDLQTSFQNQPIQNGYLDFLILKVAYFQQEQTIISTKEYASLDLKIIAESNETE